MNETQIVEINGVKMEVDLRSARVVHENIRVGTRVKLMVKETGGYTAPSLKVYPGVVVGFEPFRELPTIVVCYLNHDWSESKLHFAYINKDNGDKFDLVISQDDELPINKADVLSRLDRDIAKKREEIADIEIKRDYFLRHFNKYFESAAA